MKPYKKYEESGAFHYLWYETIPWYKECVDLIIDRVDGSCVDLGCGDGVVSNMLSDKGYNVLGIDNNECGLKLAREKNCNAEFLNADINSYKLDRKFDYMVCFNTIEHLKNPENIVRIFEESINKKAIIITDKKKDSICRSHFREYNIEDLMAMFSKFKCKELKLKTEIFIVLEISK